eukprot:168336-Prymnesium_polylepis.1
MRCCPLRGVAGWLVSSVPAPEGGDEAGDDVDAGPGSLPSPLSNAAAAACPHAAATWAAVLPISSMTAVDALWRRSSSIASTWPSSAA